MRQVGDKEQFTPFGLWVRQYLRQSDAGLAITNLDYVIEDFKGKRLMLLEEKTNGGVLHRAQKLTFKELDKLLKAGAKAAGYEYCGFYVLQFPPRKDMPGPGMTLNGKPISVEQLVAHLNFECCFCEPMTL